MAVQLKSVADQLTATKVFWTFNVLGRHCQFAKHGAKNSQGRMKLETRPRTENSPAWDISLKWCRQAKRKVISLKSLTALGTRPNDGTPSARSWLSASWHSSQNQLPKSENDLQHSIMRFFIKKFPYAFFLKISRVRFCSNTHECPWMPIKESKVRTQFNLCRNSSAKETSAMRLPPARTPLRHLTSWHLRFHSPCDCLSYAFDVFSETGWISVHCHSDLSFAFGIVLSFALPFALPFVLPSALSVSTSARSPEAEGFGAALFFSPWLWVSAGCFFLLLRLLRVFLCLETGRPEALLCGLL